MDANVWFFDITSKYRKYKINLKNNNLFEDSFCFRIQNQCWHIELKIQNFEFVCLWVYCFGQGHLLLGRDSLKFGYFVPFGLFLCILSSFIETLPIQLTFYLAGSSLQNFFEFFCFFSISSESLVFSSHGYQFFPFSDYLESILSQKNQSYHQKQYFSRNLNL